MRLIIYDCENCYKENLAKRLSKMQKYEIVFRSAFLWIMREYRLTMGILRVIIVRFGERLCWRDQSHLAIFWVRRFCGKEICMTTNTAANMISASLGVDFADGIRVSISAFHFSCFPGFWNVSLHFREPGFFITSLLCKSKTINLIVYRLSVI